MPRETERVARMLSMIVANCAVTFCQMSANSL